jgi:hypothetical protein
MEYAHEENYKDYQIKIVYDEDSFSPYEDNALFLVGYHRDFWVDRKRTIYNKETGQRETIDEGISQGLAQSIFNKGKYEDDLINEEAKDYLKKYRIFPLSAYIHSGVRLYLGTHKVCQWDSCQVGLVLASKSEWKTKDKALKAVESLIETWNDYLSGQVYGFQVYDKEENKIDSCYGFYGDEGMKDAIAEAKSIIEYTVKEETNKKQLRLKTLIKNKVELQYR